MFQIDFNKRKEGPTPSWEELGMYYKILDENLMREMLPAAFDIVNGKPVVRESSLRYCAWHGVRGLVEKGVPFLIFYHTNNGEENVK